MGSHLGFLGKLKGYSSTRSLFLIRSIISIKYANSAKYTCILWWQKDYYSVTLVTLRLFLRFMKIQFASFLISQLWPQEIKILPLGRQGPFNLYSSCHGWWCPGGAKSQGIINHGINLILPAYSGFIPTSVKCNKATPLPNFHIFWYMFAFIVSRNIQRIVSLL